MSILSWDTPPKKMSVEDWKKITADNAPPGVYTPNMSYEDTLKWKAKHIKGNDERVEIRKSFHFLKTTPRPMAYSAQMLIVVRKSPDNEPQVLISTNGKMGMSFNEFFDMNGAVKEALEVLL